MGVIKRQGLKSTFVTYFFMAFGIVSNLLIYTKMLEVQELGTIAFVLTTGITFAPFVLLGFHVMYLKYFARFEKEPTDLSRLYSLTLYGPIVLSIILCTSYLIFRESIVSYYTVNRDVPEIAIDLAILLSTIIPFISALTYVCSTLQRTAIPALLNNSIKVFQPTLVILYFYELLSFNLVLILVSGFYILLLLVFFFYQQKQRRIKFIVNPKEILALPETNKMVQFAIYGFAIGAGGMLITNIDGFMVASLLGMKDMGLYNWGLTIINAIIIPFGMLSNISSPFISSYWESGNMKELNKLYKQSANVLLLLCTGLYFAVWLGIDDLFLIIPKGNQYMLAKYAILLIGGAKVLDAAT
ncbi:MAG: lipopolysaccharide biosynthesis protein, partial [Bacteroidia bacterium]